MVYYITEDEKLGRISLTGDLGQPCSCGWVADYLCDYPVGNEKTCDRRMCEKCAAEVAPDIHYCKGHLHEYEEFVKENGVKERLQNVLPYRAFAKRKGLRL